jgi:hypothetical protein
MLCWKPISLSVLSSLVFQACGACRSPYKAFRSRSILPGNGEAGRLPDIHLFLQVTIEERRLNIHVVDTPPLLGSERKKDADGLDASHRRERVIVVDPFLLAETTRDEPRLVLDHLPCLILLELEHRLQGDQAVVGCQVDELPRMVVLDGVHLLLHCGVPGRVTLSFDEGAGFPGVRQVELGIDVVLHTSWHHRLVAEDVVDGAVAQRGVVVRGVDAVLVTLQG